MVPLQQNRARTVGTVETGPCPAFAEVADVTPVLFAKLDAQRFRLASVFLVQALVCVAIGLAVADVLIAVDGFTVPDQGEFLALKCDVIRLPHARRLRKIVRRKGPLIKRSAVMPAELGLAKAVEDLNLEQSAVVNPRVAPLGDCKLDVELVVAKRLLRHDVGTTAIAAAKQDGIRPAPRADRKQPAGIRLIEMNLVAYDPQLLGMGIAEIPTR